MSEDVNEQPRWRDGVIWPRPAPAPVDWPARFRKAADAAMRTDRLGMADQFLTLAEDMEMRPPHVVEAIGRALLGEE